MGSLFCDPRISSKTYRPGNDARTNDDLVINRTPFAKTSSAEGVSTPLNWNQGKANRSEDSCHWTVSTPLNWNQGKAMEEFKDVQF